MLAPGAPLAGSYAYACLCHGGVGTKFALGGPLSVMPSVGLHAQQASHVCVLVLYSVGLNVRAMYSY